MWENNGWKSRRTKPRLQSPRKDINMLTKSQCVVCPSLTFVSLIWFCARLLHVEYYSTPLVRPLIYDRGRGHVGSMRSRMCWVRWFGRPRHDLNVQLLMKSHSISVQREIIIFQFAVQSLKVERIYLYNDYPLLMSC